MSKSRKVDVKLPSGVICEPYEAGYDWFIRNESSYVRRGKEFTVCLCPECDRCYQKDWRTDGIINFYIDFPKKSVTESKICEVCESKITQQFIQEDIVPIEKSKTPFIGRTKKEILKVYREVAKKGNKTVIKRLKELEGRKWKRS